MFHTALGSYHLSLWLNNIKSWNVTWDIKSREVFVFLMSLVFFLLKFQCFLCFFSLFFFIFIIDLMLQDKHLIFMVELFQFQIVQWSEMRGDCSCCWYWWNCWTSLFKFCIISIHFDTWHWLVFLWTSWLMYLLYLYITKTVVPKNYKSPTNKIWHHNMYNKLKGTSYSITVIKI